MIYLQVLSDVFTCIFQCFWRGHLRQKEDHFSRFSRLWYPHNWRASLMCHQSYYILFEIFCLYNNVTFFLFRIYFILLKEHEVSNCNDNDLPLFLWLRSRAIENWTCLWERSQSFSAHKDWHSTRSIPIPTRHSLLKWTVGTCHFYL